MNANELQDALSAALDLGDEGAVQQLIADHPGSARALTLLWAEHRRAQRQAADLEGQGWFPIEKAATYSNYKASTIRQLARLGALGAENVMRELTWPHRIFVSPTAIGRLATRPYKSSGPRKPSQP